VSSLKDLRLTADDFEVKSIIGRGHFGEVCVKFQSKTHFTSILPFHPRLVSQLPVGVDKGTTLLV